MPGKWRVGISSPGGDHTILLDERFTKKDAIAYISKALGYPIPKSRVAKLKDGDDYLTSDKSSLCYHLMRDEEGLGDD